VLPMPVSFERVRQFADELGKVEGLKIEWVGGSAEEGAIIGVSVQKELDLIQATREILMVEGVEKQAEKIVVTLKAA
jgi:hypothetical protein